MQNEKLVSVFKTGRSLVLEQPENDLKTYAAISEYFLTKVVDWNDEGLLKELADQVVFWYSPFR